MRRAQCRAVLAVPFLFVASVAQAQDNFSPKGREVSTGVGIAILGALVLALGGIFYALYRVIRWRIQFDRQHNEAAVAAKQITIEQAEGMLRTSLRVVGAIWGGFALLKLLALVLLTWVVMSRDVGFAIPYIRLSLEGVLAVGLLVMGPMLFMGITQVLWPGTILALVNAVVSFAANTFLSDRSASIGDGSAGAAILSLTIAFLPAGMSFFAIQRRAQRDTVLRVTQQQAWPPKTLDGNGGSPPAPTAISFSCTCGKRLKVAAKSGGKKVTCPMCKASLKVPTA